MSGTLTIERRILLNDSRRRGQELMDQDYVLMATQRSWPSDDEKTLRSRHYEFQQAIKNSTGSGYATIVVEHEFGKDMYSKMNTRVEDLQDMLQTDVIVELSTIVAKPFGVRIASRGFVQKKHLNERGMLFMEDVVHDTYLNLLIRVNQEKYRAR